MTELAELIEKRRIAQNNLRISKSAKAEQELAEIDRAIDLLRLKEVEDDNERE